MKIVMTSTPLAGHANPMLAIARILISEGHEVLAFTGRAFQDRITGIGAAFRPLPASAELDLIDPFSNVPELKEMPPGLGCLRVAVERLLVDNITAQHVGLQEVLREFQADIVISDEMFFGILPMLLWRRSERPPIALYGTSVLHWLRDDGAPPFIGLAPAMGCAQREEYSAIAREYDRVVNEPIVNRVNNYLAKLGVGPLSTTLYDSVVELADAYMQLSVPAFEFPRAALPSSVRFVGALPIIPNQAPLPPWASDLDSRRRVVLVSQGTVANHDFGLLVMPTLEALANEKDLLVVVSAGGRPLDAIPGPVPANARLASYLPFEWLMPKVDVFVTNGGYGSVNQSLSYGIPLVTAGLTEDKADVNARVAWSGVGIDLATNAPSHEALRDAVRTVLDTDQYRVRAAVMAQEFKRMDTRAEILRVVESLRLTPKPCQRESPDLQSVHQID